MQHGSLCFLGGGALPFSAKLCPATARLVHAYLCGRQQCLPGVYQVLEDLEHLVSCRLWDSLNWSQACVKFWSPEAWT